MDLDLAQLANLGEFIGGIAVLVTLVYLVIQVRQGNSNSRASARQTLIEAWSQTQFDLAHHPALLRILGGGLADYRSLDDDAKVQFDFAVSRYVMNVYNGVLLHREGMLDRETLDLFGGFLAISMEAPGGKDWWESWPQPREVAEYFEDYIQQFWLVTPRAADLGSLLDTLLQAA